METAIDFKSLRAKFQEELQSKERPTLPHKPRRLPLPSGGTTSPAFSIHSSAVDKNHVAPSVVFREDRKVASVKRPVSVPTSFFHHGNENGGSGVARLSLKDRQFPLVLPASFHPEPKHEPITSSSKLVTSPIKCSMKAMPAPFKPTTFSKCIKDILEGAGERAENGHKPRESSLIGESVGNGFSHHSEVQNCESSPEHNPSASSPPAAENSSSVGHVLSTLEKAKKRFSPKNLLVYARPKSFYASKSSSASPPPSVDYENVHHEANTWLSATSSTYISPPLLQANGFTHMTRTDLHVSGDVKPVVRYGGVPPARRPLPDLASLGRLPLKPRRPPQVDLGSYTRMLASETRPEITSLNLANIPEASAADMMDLESPAVPPPPEFEAPEFPDFEASVLEALNGNLINLASLEQEATEFGAPPPIPPIPEEAIGLHLHDPGKCDEVVHKRVMYPAEAVAAPQERSAGPEHWTESWSGTALEPEAPKGLTLEMPKPEVTSEMFMNGAHHVPPDLMCNELPSEPSLSQQGDHYEPCDNVYEEVEAITKLQFRENSRKRKGPPKNPYAESPVKEETRKSVRQVSQWKERLSPDHHDEKELRKREKQRLEREKKEQKEREKKENLMKKKFKITGQEEPMYHARVLVTSKLRKHDLQVKSGDTVSIIRTTNCPKGKWLARDAEHKYGYISVMNVELNMKEMLELGKRASQAAGRGAGELDTLSLSSRSSHYNLVLTSSFTDDSEEWSGEDATLSTLGENMGPNRANSMPDVFGGHASAEHALSAGSMEDIPSQVKHVALQKLAVFFQNSREDLHSVTPLTDSADSNFTAPGLLSVVEEPYVEEDQCSFADMELLPPPDLYADSV